MVDLYNIVYYSGFILAILLCRGLGRIFYVPMLIDLGFNVALNLGFLSGWDIRLLMVTFGFGIFVWVLALSGALNKSTFLAVLLLDLSFVFVEIFPDLKQAGTGQAFWNATSTGIVDVWMLSSFIVIVSMAVKSTIGARIYGRFVDILTNPRKRFLLPMGAWAGVVVIGRQFQGFLPPELYRMRFDIAALCLVWGWVAIELPFFISYHRIKKRYS